MNSSFDDLSDNKYTKYIFNNPEMKFCLQISLACPVVSEANSAL